VGLFAGKHGERTAKKEKHGKDVRGKAPCKKLTAELRCRDKDGGVTPPSIFCTAELRRRAKIMERQSHSIPTS